MNHSTRLLLPTSALALLLGCSGRLSPTFEPPAPLPPPAIAPPPSFASGAAAFGGVDRLTPQADGFRVEWTPIAASGGGASADYSYSLYVGFDGDEPDFAAPPLSTSSPAAASGELVGLPSGRRVRVAVRAVPLADPLATPDRNEAALDGVVAPPLYVDLAAAPGGDGSAPDRAFRAINDGVVAALGLVGGANLLVAQGSYVEEVALLGAIHVWGGYPSGFVGARDPALHATRVTPGAGAAVGLRLFASESPTIVDGLTFDGGGSVPVGIDVRNADLCLANVQVLQFAGEGLACNSRQRISRLRLHRVALAGHGAEGLQATGAFRASFAQSSFSANGHEGIEFDDLSVETNDRSTLRVWRCAISGNVEDGVDAEFDELDPLSGSSSQGGTIDVAIEECVVERNGACGVLLDVDYDAGDGVLAQVLLRDNVVRANGGRGIELDGDQHALYVLVGNRTAANRLGGVRAGSDALDGGRATYLIANHADFGAGGAGFELFGGADALFSHVAISGAAGRSLDGNGPARFVNGAIWGAAAPIDATVEQSFLADGGGGAGCFAGPVAFERAPSRSFFLAAVGGIDRLPLPAGAALVAGETIEIDDDGVARSVTSVTSGEARFAPALAAPPAAGSFVAVFAGTSVAESFALPLGSSWIDRGDALERDLDGSATDVGVLGGRLAAFAASEAGGYLPLLVERLEPAMGSADVAPVALAVRFTKPLDGASVDATSFAVTAAGLAVPGSLSVAGATVTFTPTVPFTAGPLVIALGAALAADPTEGGDLLALPFRFTVVVP